MQKFDRFAYMKPHLKLALTKAAIVLTPSYAMAFATEKMVYVVPTLAAAGFVAATLEVSGEAETRNVDEDGEDNSDHE